MKYLLLLVACLGGCGDNLPDEDGSPCSIPDDVHLDIVPPAPSDPVNDKLTVSGSIVVPDDAVVFEIDVGVVQKDVLEKDFAFGTKAKIEGHSWSTEFTLDQLLAPWSGPGSVRVVARAWTNCPNPMPAVETPPFDVAPAK
jgi:hypothetical protein